MLPNRQAAGASLDNSCPVWVKSFKNRPIQLRWELIELSQQPPPVPEWDNDALNCRWPKINH